MTLFGEHAIEVAIAYNLPFMTVTVRSFAKINLGLYIGATRADGFHDLRTIYQTIALHDVIRVSAGRGTGIEIVCDDPRVPCDESNTCHRIAERVLDRLGAVGKIRIEIEKRLPLQGGMGAGSSNAVATLLGLERALKKRLSQPDRLKIAADRGSDLPLFLIGGTALGVGRGEEVYPVPDLQAIPMVVVTPEVGVSTPKAFAAWDELVAGGLVGSAFENPNPVAKNATRMGYPATRVVHPSSAIDPASRRARTPVATQAEWRTGLSAPHSSELTHSGASDRLLEVGRAMSAWLMLAGKDSPHTGASARGRSRAGKLLLDLVRTGIENDFERVVFPQYPELRDMKSELERAGADYASLSGSGSTLYGLFRTREASAKAVFQLRKQGLKAQATVTLTRAQYWKKIVDC